MSQLDARVKRLESRRAGDENGLMPVMAMVEGREPSGPWVVKGPWPETTFATKADVEAFLNEHASELRGRVKVIWIHKSYADGDL